MASAKLSSLSLALGLVAVGGCAHSTSSAHGSAPVPLDRITASVAMWRMPRKSASAARIAA